MNILITGANGFIGRHLIGTLLQEETHHIWGIARQPLALDSKYYCHLTVDLTRKNWTDVLPSPIDTVVHLAQSNRYRAQDFPEGSRDMLAVNVNSTLELLEWARKNHVKQFILSSTGNVYKPSPKLFVEDDSCFPTNMYAATKLSAEYFVQQYREFFQGIVLRLFSIYGPHQKRRLLPMIIDRIKTGGEIILASEKGIYLTPLYVSDCVEMIWRLKLR